MSDFKPGLYIISMYPITKMKLAEERSRTDYGGINVNVVLNDHEMVYIDVKAWPGRIGVPRNVHFNQPVSAYAKRGWYVQRIA